VRIFISYAHVDKVIVEDWIVANLRASHHDVWIDERLFVGQGWKQQLLDAIQNNDALVYALTPESIASEVCQWEVAKAVELGKPIIPVLMQARTQLPEWLGQLQYVDFSNGPKGDVVAKLLGGLQQLSSSQVPPAPRNPNVTSALIVKTMEEKPSQTNIIIKLLRDPAFQAVLAILALVTTIVVALAPTLKPDPPIPTPTTSVSIPTPATPGVTALRDLDIRSGPGSGFSRLNILPSGNALDIMGISDDRSWYQVLLLDGTTGWVLASESGARFNGDRGVLKVVIPTLTPTDRPTETPLPTSTPSATDKPTETYTPSVTSTNTATLAQTDMPTNVAIVSTNTPTATSTSTLTATSTLTSSPTENTLPNNLGVVEPTSTLWGSTVTKQYPCDGTIVDNGSNSSLYVIYSIASNNLQPIASVKPGSSVILLGDTLLTGRKWYHIAYNDQQSKGWIWDSYIVPLQSCP